VNSHEAFSRINDFHVLRHWPLGDHPAAVLGTHGWLNAKIAGSSSAQDGGIEVTLPATKGVVASRLNLTLEHFSRILHELAAEGLIEVRGRSVHIRDVDRLRGFDP